jgi:hypothetical protein
MGFNSSADEKFEDAINRSRTLEPSGDAEHDKLTDEALGLDALHPLRDAEKRAAYDEVVADANDDHSD